MYRLTPKGKAHAETLHEALYPGLDKLKLENLKDLQKRLMFETAYTDMRGDGPQTSRPSVLSVRHSGTCEFSERCESAAVEVALNELEKAELIREPHGNDKVGQVRWEPNRR